MQTIFLSTSLRRAMQVVVPATILAAAGVSSMLSASAETRTSCPADYFKLETVLYNHTTGAVVSAPTEVSGAAQADGRSRRADWTVGDLCQHNNTGDVWIFDWADRSAAVSK